MAFIGAGNYATGVLIPAFKATGARLKTVVSNGGVSGLHAGRKFGFGETTTDTEKVLADAEVNAVVITTRHDSHARLVCDALRAGKHVFVEKPLCLTLDELQEIETVYSSFLTSRSLLPLLMVGFNRRFAPQVQKITRLLEAVQEPKSFIMTVNAGAIAPDHWTQDPAVGGGRIIGEGCHFVDLLRYLAGHPVVSVQATRIRGGCDGAVADDKMSFTLSFADGSFGTVHYLANGHKSFPKERLEVFCAGRILQLDNFRTLTGYGWPGFRRMHLWRQDKGQQACARAFVTAVEQGGPPPIAIEEIIEVTRVTLEVAGRHEGSVGRG